MCFTLGAIMLTFRFIYAQQRGFWNYVKQIKDSMSKQVSLYLHCDRFQKSTHLLSLHYRIRSELILIYMFYIPYMHLCRLQMRLTHPLAILLVLFAGCSLSLQSYSRSINAQSETWFPRDVSYWTLLLTSCFW